MIHPSAVVSDRANIDPSCQVGPFAVVEASVTLAAGVCLGPHSVVHSGVQVGQGTYVGAHAVLGGAPQHRDHDPNEPSQLSIGEGCVISEFVSIHRGASVLSGITRIGARCRLMTSSHVGHDCQLADDVTIANAVLLGGSVELHQGVNVGGGAAIHQGARVGRWAMVGGGAMVSQDVPPFGLVWGDRACLVGLNTKGLRTLGLDAETRTHVRRQFQACFFARGAPVDDRWSQEFTAFRVQSARGLCRARR